MSRRSVAHVTRGIASRTLAAVAGLVLARVVASGARRLLERISQRRASGQLVASSLRNACEDNGTLQAYRIRAVMAGLICNDATGPLARASRKSIGETEHIMRSLPRHLSVAAAGVAICVTAIPQSLPEANRPAAILPLESEAAPKLIPYPPLAEPLARGVVIVQFRTEHFRVMPVFGKIAVELSPRIGHLHVTVDDAPGTWAHTSEDPIIVVGLTPGAHKLRLELADPTHKIVATEIVAVTVPDMKAPASRQR
jgi:hypothetical protein